MVEVQPASHLEQIAGDIWSNTEILRRSTVRLPGGLASSHEGNMPPKELLEQRADERVGVDAEACSGERWP